MLLKSLELQGFKTFPEKTVLTFDKGITTVVGPNGSGKSNISDAIRWVLGEQSIKTLRCSKMEDVIFNGTTERKAKGFASVTLTIINDDKKLFADADEISITRRYYRSGESEYLINQKEVRLKDIHELFMDTGLGRDGYSMISQGKIDSIVSSRSEDRREIFEEAAGISRYRYRKAEAQRKLEQAEENLLRLRDIESELEERVGPLKEQSIKAKNYLELSNQKKSIEIGTWLFTLCKSGDILKEYDEKIEISKNQHENIEKSLDEFNNRLDSISKNILSHTVNIDEKRREITNCEATVIEKKGQISVLKNDILHNNENMNRLKNELSFLEQSFINIDNDLNIKNDDIKLLKIRYIEKEKELEKNKQELTKLINSITASTNASDELSVKLSQLSRLASEKQVKTMTSKSTISDLKLKEKELDKNIDLYIENIEEEEKDLYKYEKNVNYFKNLYQDSVSKFKKEENTLKEQNDKCVILKCTADKCTLDAESQIRKVRLLEELERNLEGFIHSVKFIMKEVQKGLLSGIHGPVSRLIKVPSKYSLAVETALGSAMQNIVVGNEEDAKRAILALKSKNIGRATFLPITTVKGYEISEPDLIKCKGFIGVSSTLCSCEAQYNNILKFLLGRIVIVDNIDNAIVIAKKFSYKFRIVTLDGQVINSGGSLTGGALNKNAGLLNRTAQIDDLRKDAEILSDKARKARSSFNDVQQQVNKIKENVELLKEQAEQSKSSYEKENQEYQKKIIEINSIKSNYNKLCLEKKETLNKIENITLMADTSGNELNTIEVQIQEVEKALNKIGVDITELSEKREIMNSKIHESHLNLFSVKKDMEKVESETNSILEKKNNADNKRAEFFNTLNDLNLKNSSISNEISQIEQEIVSLKEHTNELDKTILNLQAEKMNLEQSITNLRGSERDKLNEKEKVALEIARLEDKRSNIQKEYDVIIAKLWDDYELTRREALESFDVIESTPQIHKQLNELRLKIKNLGIVNVAAIEEYKEVSERYEFMKTQIEDVEKSKKELYKLINELTTQMKSLFIERFNKINENFNNIFKELFGGGKGELALTDTNDILSSGIEIFVQPPGKIVTHLEALSGGERALIAIAIYFAIMKVSPAPFCVLDEIEAALDEVNVDRFAAYLRKMNKNTQFIVISHRRGTMEEADILYGVTMQNEGVSKLLELRASEIEKSYVS